MSHGYNEKVAKMCENVQKLCGVVFKRQNRFIFSIAFIYFFFLTYYNNKERNTACTERKKIIKHNTGEPVT